MSLFNLKDKIALITGGNGGIGLGIANGFLSEGASVILLGRNKDKLEAAKKKIINEYDDSRVLAEQCDVTKRSDISEILDKIQKKFSGLDILVNNAGTNKRANEPHLLSDDDWRFVIDTNLTSIHNVTSLCFPIIKKRGGGKIINIGSIMSIFGSAYASAYAASKGGVVQYTKSFAIAWAKYNVQVNAILPGWIVTEMTDEFGKLFPERYKLVEERTPTGRWGIPEDISGTAIFLASSASKFVTGTTIPVDGGYSVW